MRKFNFFSFFFLFKASTQLREKKCSLSLAQADINTFAVCLIRSALAFRLESFLFQLSKLYLIFCLYKQDKNQIRFSEARNKIVFFFFRVQKAFRQFPTFFKFIFA
jgi:hypothetical protein